VKDPVSFGERRGGRERGPRRGNLPPRRSTEVTKTKREGGKSQDKKSRLSLLELTRGEKTYRDEPGKSSKKRSIPPASVTRGDGPQLNDF